MTDPPFKTGDRVRLKTGKSPIQVMEVDYFHCSSKDTMPPRLKRWARPRKGWYIRFAYVSSLRCHDHNGESYGSYDSRTWREADDFVFLDPQPEKEEPMTATTPILYETKQGKFGTKCGENSEGKWILEIKGSNGEVAAFDKEELTEVIPYSVELTRMGDYNQGEKRESRHYRAKKGELKVDDILMQVTTGKLWRVSKVDSKCRTLRESQNGFLRISAERVSVGEE